MRAARLTAAVALALLLAIVMPAAASVGAADDSISIAGTLSHPSGRVPATTVVALSENGSVFWTRVESGERTYSMEGLPAGRYAVIAYVESGGIASAYDGCSAALGDSCRLSRPVQIVAPPGADLSSIDLFRWRAVETLPPMPPVLKLEPLPPTAGESPPVGLTPQGSGEMLFYLVAAGLVALGGAGIVYAGVASRGR